MVNIAGEVPVDGSVEETRVLRRRRLQHDARERAERTAVATLDPHGEGALLPQSPRGRRADRQAWSGAIIVVLLEGGAMRFSEIAQAIPQLSDRLLSERMKELEARGIVERRVQADAPGKVSYALTEMGHELAPALQQLKSWSHRWLD
jgi:DNA-binding HxlR family transcriptional regulator